MGKDNYFQDFVPGNICMGCGPANKKGMRIKSMWADEEKIATICRWKIRKWCTAGLPDHLHGGAAGSLLDCNGVWIAIATKCKLENRLIGSEPFVWYVTRFFEVDLPLPIPMDVGFLEVRTKVLEFTEKKCVAFGSIWANGKELVLGRKTVAIKVNPTSDQVKFLLKK